MRGCRKGVIGAGRKTVENDRVMSWVGESLQWFDGKEELVGAVMALSALTFFSTLLLVPWVLVRLPADYFSRERRKRVLLKPAKPRHLAVRIALLVGKNLLGAVLVLVGVTMLVLPGQGLITILMGLLLIDFPGKYRVERFLVTRQPVLRSINWLRRRKGHPPLQLE